MPAETLEKAIFQNILRVEEFKIIHDWGKANQCPVFLFGGTAASFAHYVKEAYLASQDPHYSRYQHKRFDYDYTNIFRSTQDADIVVDCSQDKIAALEAAIMTHLSHLKGQKIKWELRSLRERIGEKYALLEDFDFLNQHTDSHSVGLIEITNFSHDSDRIRDLRHWGKKTAPFIVDVASGQLRFYRGHRHHETSRAREGINPPIIAVIRYLTKLFQFSLHANPTDLVMIREIIDAFNPAAERSNYRVNSWILRNAHKLFTHASDVEYAWNTLEELGLRKKLMTLDNPSEKYSLAWWMNKEPLRSRPVGQGNGATATDLGISIVAHDTRDLPSFENLIRNMKGKPNVFISRAGEYHEAAAFGNGHYTKIGRQGAIGSHITVRYNVLPYAREGTDFVHIKDDDYVIFKNRNALEVIYDSIESTPAGYFEVLLNQDHRTLDIGLIEMFKRRILRPTVGIPPDEIERINALFQNKINRLLTLANYLKNNSETNSFIELLSEWMTISIVLKNTDFIINNISNPHFAYLVFEKLIKPQLPEIPNPEILKALLQKSKILDHILPFFISTFSAHPEKMTQIKNMLPPEVIRYQLDEHQTHSRSRAKSQSSPTHSPLHIPIPPHYVKLSLDEQRNLFRKDSHLLISKQELDASVKLLLQMSDFIRLKNIAKELEFSFLILGKAANLIIKHAQLMALKAKGDPRLRFYIPPQNLFELLEGGLFDHLIIIGNKVGLFGGRKTLNQVEEEARARLHKDFPRTSFLITGSSAPESVEKIIETKDFDLQGAIPLWINTEDQRHLTKTLRSYDDLLGCFIQGFNRFQGSLSHLNDNKNMNGVTYKSEVITTFLEMTIKNRLRITDGDIAKINRVMSDSLAQSILNTLFNLLGSGRLSPKETIHLIERMPLVQIRFQSEEYAEYQRYLSASTPEENIIQSANDLGIRFVGLRNWPVDYIYHPSFDPFVSTLTLAEILSDQDTFHSSTFIYIIDPDAIAGIDFLVTDQSQIQIINPNILRLLPHINPKLNFYDLAKSVSLKWNVEALGFIERLLRKQLIKELKALLLPVLKKLIIELKNDKSASHFNSIVYNNIELLFSFLLEHFSSYEIFRDSSFAGSWLLIHEFVKPKFSYVLLKKIASDESAFKFFIALLLTRKTDSELVGFFKTINRSNHSLLINHPEIIEALLMNGTHEWGVISLLKEIVDDIRILQHTSGLSIESPLMIRISNLEKRNPQWQIADLIDDFKKNSSFKNLTPEEITAIHTPNAPDSMKIRWKIAEKFFRSWTNRSDCHSLISDLRI